MSPPIKHLLHSLAPRAHSYLEAIHLFVEVLDAFFGNVCELDLVFSFNKCYEILDEIVTAGELMETCKATILGRVEEIEQQIILDLEKTGGK